MRSHLRWLLLCAALPLFGAAPDLLHDRWPAVWITHPGALHQYGVYHFRHTFTLAAKPEHFIVHVSADNRYQLFVNGTSVSRGPAAGDLWHWRYETVDLAPQLKAGPNTLAAVVWNFAKGAPSAQLTARTAFIVQGHGDAESVANTGTNWKSAADDAYSLYDRRKRGYPVGELFGAGESVDGRRYPWGWQQPAFDDHAWGPAAQVATAHPRGTRTDFARWFLVEDTLPPMEEVTERFAAVPRSSQVDVPAAFVAGRAPVTVPAHTRATLLLKMLNETTGYPELHVRGGRDARIELTYTEAMRKPVPGKNISSWPKGNRDEIEGKEAHGMGDAYVADGGERRFQPLWWRVFRYVEVSIETSDAPLTLLDITNERSLYPFAERAKFESSDPRLAKIWEVGWRTARLSSHEFFTDGPYWEALQYAGDMRVVALSTLVGSGDDRLMRNAITQFDDSRIPDGLTYSRFPTADPQIIPPYSLIWINAVHDYWLSRSDTAFVRARLDGVRTVLAWFDKHAQPSGLLGPQGWWPFVDWVNTWKSGVPPGETDGQSAITSLQWAAALRDAAELELALGDAVLAERYERRRAAVIDAVRRLCWDAQRGLVADTPARTSYSQHATILGVLEDVVPAARQAEAIEKALSDKTLSQPTLYFSYYQGRALAKAGLAERYLDTLGPWYDMLKLGLTTWPETPGDARSDCHGWSTSPNFELFASVAGITPAAPGFARVRVEPHLGALTWLKATYPHERGGIRVEFERAGGTLRGKVILPAGLTGTYVHAGRSVDLHPGENRIE